MTEDQDLKVWVLIFVCEGILGFFFFFLGMGSKLLLYPAPAYRALETYWDSDEDAPGPRCGHTLTAVAATKTHGPRLILFGGATAIEGGAASSAPGIS